MNFVKPTLLAFLCCVAVASGVLAQEPMVVEIDLRKGAPKDVEVTVSNAAIHREPFGPGATYWAPQLLNRWATITYRIRAPFAIGGIKLEAFGVNAWNRNADVTFDSKAQAFLRVSPDGRTWTPIFSTTPEGGVTKNDHWADAIRGSRTIYLQARLYGSRQANRAVHHVQFLRSEPDRGRFPKATLFPEVNDAATVRGGDKQPARPDGKPEALLARFTDPMDSKETLKNVGTVPECLRGSWEMVVKSSDEGRTVERIDARMQPFAAFRLGADGMSVGHRSLGLSPIPFVAVTKAADAGGLQRFVLIVGDTVWLIHGPTEDDYVLLRKIEQRSGKEASRAVFQVR